jgi:hypothetical protein
MEVPMLYIQAHDGSLVNLALIQEIVIENGVLYAVGPGGRHKLAATAEGANLTTVLNAIKTALGASGYNDLSGAIF